jgi:hypothetical protein
MKKKIIILSLTIGGFLAAPFPIYKIRYPATLKSVSSPDGRYVAEIRWTPMNKSSLAGWFDIIFPTATRMYAAVRETESTEPLFWVPLDLGNDLAGDYRRAPIIWSAHEVKFSSIRSSDVHINMLLGSVRTQINVQK